MGLVWALSDILQKREIQVMVRFNALTTNLAIPHVGAAVVGNQGLGFADQKQEPCLY